MIHPGGRASTQALLTRAGITATRKVLDVCCGVATTAVEIACRYGVQVTAVDIAPLVLERAGANVRAANATEHWPPNSAGAPRLVTSRKPRPASPARAQVPS